MGKNHGTPFLTLVGGVVNGKVLVISREKGKVITDGKVKKYICLHAPAVQPSPGESIDNVN